MSSPCWRSFGVAPTRHIPLIVRLSMGVPGPSFRSTYLTISTISQHLAVQRAPSSTNHLRIVHTEAMPLLQTQPFRGTLRIQETRSTLHTHHILSSVIPPLHIRVTDLHLTKQIPRP